MDLEKNLRDRCKVISGDDGDSFVGVKADTDDAIIYFPIGYQLPENDVDLRIDVQNLFGVLSVFMKEDKVIEARKFEAPQTVDFPIHAYLKVITSFCVLADITLKVILNTRQALREIHRGPEQFENNEL